MKDAEIEAGIEAFLGVRALFGGRLQFQRQKFPRELWNLITKSCTLLTSSCAAG
jgi:hypothetical protein